MMENTYFISDTHIGHRGLLKHEPHHASIEERDELVFENLGKLPKGSVLHHLGDLGWKAVDVDRFFKAIPAGVNVHLVRGNHDDKAAWKQRDRFCTAREAAYIKIRGVKIYLHHYACRVWRTSNRGSFHLHGHSHGNLPELGRSMDCYGLAPIPFEEIYEKLKDRPFTEHHPI